jgi:DNA excision repair protein ERCC-3
MNDGAPLWIQSDGTLLADGQHPDFPEAREFLRQVAELVKCPAGLHTYRLTPVTLWNAAEAGWTSEAVLERLGAYARRDVPPGVADEVRRRMGLYGRFRLVRREDRLLLECRSAQDLAMVREAGGAVRWLEGMIDERTAVVRGEGRGLLKQALAAAGIPVIDEAGYRDGGRLRVAMRAADDLGCPVQLRDYQQAAVDAFIAGGSGVVVLPCGAGKTWVGMGAIARLNCETLILTPNGTSVSQWIRELTRRTTLTADEVGAYTGQQKQVRPVTVATYQVLTHRRSKADPYLHRSLFMGREWGLIIYDEVHLLPAPVFRMTADLQATRRLGLTATLVREDGRETDVFSLIGPKRYELPWRAVERKGFVARVRCTEVRVPLDAATAARYAAASRRDRPRVAGENPRKADALRDLLERHAGEPTLVIGHYLNQLRALARRFSLPLVTGETPPAERQRLFDRFNRGEIRALAVSRVANFAVDLPDASVAIQVSGSFGSRQEEAQRLGRVLRPKAAPASFYSLVSDGTVELEYSRKRRQFLLEQGYVYETEHWADEPLAFTGEGSS